MNYAMNACNYEGPELTINVDRFEEKPIIIDNSVNNITLKDLRFFRDGQIKIQGKQYNVHILFDTGATQSHINRRLVNDCNPIPNLSGRSQGAHGEAIQTPLYVFDLEIEEIVINNIIAFTCEKEDVIIGMDVLGKFDSTIQSKDNTLVWEFDTSTFNEKLNPKSEIRFIK